MAHFAELDENNVVQQVLVVSNDDIDNLPFPESEPVGIAFLNTFLPGKRWAQTSYNHNFRVRYAGIGFVFYPDCKATPYGGFSYSKPADYFVFDDAQCMWIPPEPYPTDGKSYYWDFESRHWALSRIQQSVPITVVG